MWLSNIKPFDGKVLLFIVLFVGLSLPAKADPRYRPPATPDETLQNDRDLEDSLGSHAHDGSDFSVDLSSDFIRNQNTLQSGATAYPQFVVTGSSVSAPNIESSTSTQKHSDTVNSLSAGSVRNRIRNTSNTASSEALLLLEVAGSSAGDAYVNASISGVQNWAWGIDNSDGDSWILTPNATLGTGNVIRMSVAGEMNRPLQPCFFARNSARVENQTGDGTSYTVAWDTEVFDQGGDFSSTAFTAPVTGRYAFTIHISFSSLATTHTSGTVQLVTSNRTHAPEYTVSSMPFTRFPFTFPVITDMDANDTASVLINVAGGTKVVDFESSGSFSGALSN